MKNARGFTLIELMIAVAIVGVLVAIAYPSYQNSLIKGNRAAARAYLLEVSQKQQQFLLDNRAYATKAELEGIGTKAPPEVDRFYTIAVTPDNTKSPPIFDVQADPRAGTRQANDGWQKIDQAGTKNSEKHGTW